MSADFSVTESSEFFTQHSDLASGDQVLKYTMPQAEYMYGCVATAVGMLLGYYDTYGYTVGNNIYNFSGLIEGTISIDSRGSDGGSIYDMDDPSKLAQFIASKEYVNRFYNTSASTEKQYTYINGNPALGLNISVWNCLADYLGTGQYWRSNGDLSTTYYNLNLASLNSVSQTETIGGYKIPIKYLDFKYGLSLYVESRGFSLDEEKTASYEVSDDAFDILVDEIDAGHPVLLSMKSQSGGHMVIVYGYNAITQEVIFDDTYRSNCRMKWAGTYEYSNDTYSISGISTVVFDTDEQVSIKPDLILKEIIVSDTKNATQNAASIASDKNVYLFVTIKNAGSRETDKNFDVKIYIDGIAVATKTITKSISAGSSYSFNVDMNTLSAGTHTIKIAIDTGNTIAEVSEDNNVYTRTVNIVEAVSPDVSKVLYITSGQTSSGLRINSGGKVHVSNGGVVSQTTANSSGSLYISSGGQANDTIIRSAGSLCVNSGGRAVNTTVSSGGTLRFSSGAVHKGTLQVASGASISFFSGSVVDFTVAERTTADAYLINNILLLKGVPTYTITIAADQANGIYKLASGAAIFDQTVSIYCDNTKFGTLSVNGAALNYNGKTYSLIRNNDNLTLNIAKSSSGITSGAICIYSSGAVTSKTNSINNPLIVSGQNDSMTVSNGGTANNTAVNYSGFVSVSNGGIINYTTINRYGSVCILNGGTANSTTVNSFGFFHVSSGGSANNTLVDPWGFFYVSSGGSITRTTVNSLGQLDISGGTANSTTISSGARVYVSDEGIMQNTTVNFAGNFSISSGGTASNTIIKSNASLTIDENASHYGIMNIYSGAVVSAYQGGVIDFTVSGRAPVDNYLISNLDLIKGNPTYTITVSSSQSTGIYKLAQGASAFTGAISIYTNTSCFGILAVNGKTLDYNGKTYALIQSNGCLTLNIANSSGTIPPPIVSSSTISSGAVNVYSSSYLTSGAKLISGALIKGGGNNSMFISSGGIAIQTSVLSGGILHVSSGGSAMQTSIADGGNLRVSSGATLKSTTVNSKSYLYMYNGAVAYDTVVNSGGNVTLNSGAKHSGSLQINSGAVVSAYQGAIIDFTVSDRTAADDYLINNLALIKVAPSYTITVANNQDFGIYKLAQNASALTGSISIGTNSASIGTLTVNGDALNSNGVTYKLNNINGDLTLTITEKAVTVQPDTRTNLLSNGISQIVAWDKEQGKVGYVAANGNVAPPWCGIWEWGGTIDLGNGNKVAEKDLWRVTGVGHFKGSNVDYDGVLLYNGIGNTFAAWTDLKNPSYGYVDLCHVEGNFQTQCLTDLDGDEYDDVLIYDEKGSFGVVSGAAEWHSIWDAPANNIQKLIGAGNFGASDGLDSLLVKNTKDNAYFLWHNNDPSFKTWDWSQTYIGSLDNNWIVAGIGDFKADGIDDIVMWNTSNGEMWMWNDGKADKQHWIGTISNDDWEVAAVGDYNGDGKEDLLLRELKSGWGGVGYWASGEATGWTDLNARIETNMESKFAVIA